MESTPLRLATAKIIGYGTVGTMLDMIDEILVEIDSGLAVELEVITDKVLERFKDAEDEVWVLTGTGE